MSDTLNVHVQFEYFVGINEERHSSSNYIYRIIKSFTFTFREFSRRFYPKLFPKEITLSVCFFQHWNWAFWWFLITKCITASDSRRRRKCAGPEVPLFPRVFQGNSSAANTACFKWRVSAKAPQYLNVVLTTNYSGSLPGPVGRGEGKASRQRNQRRSL